MKSRSCLTVVPVGKFPIKLERKEEIRERKKEKVRKKREREREKKGKTTYISL